MSATVSVRANHGFVVAQALASLLSASPAPIPDRFVLNAAPQNAASIRFEADEEIYAEGDAASSFYRLERGVVRMCKFLGDGRRQIDAFYTAGDVFGFEAGDTYEYCAEAVTDCSLVRYRRNGLERMVANDEAMALSLFSYAMQCLQRSRARRGYD